MALSFCESVGYSISENSTQGVVFGRIWTRCLVVREWSVLRTDWRCASRRISALPSGGLGTPRGEIQAGWRTGANSLVRESTFCWFLAF